MRSFWRIALLSAAVSTPSVAMADPATDWWEIANRFNLTFSLSGRPRAKSR